MDAAAADLIAFLDDDAVADRAWLRRHSEILANDSLLASTGRILPIAPENGRGLLDLGEQAFVVDRSDPWWFERANFGGVASGGSNMVLKRQAFSHGLRFSETLGLGTDLAGFEEHHLLFTIIKGGGRVAYVPDAVVRHGDPKLLIDAEDGRSARVYRYNAAYLTMLLVEEPEFRYRTVRYAVQGFLGRQVPWRHRPQASRLKMLAAGSGGPLVYFRSRLARR
jgi:hypothetical protein